MSLSSPCLRRGTVGALTVTALLVPLGAAVAPAAAAPVPAVAAAVGAGSDARSASWTDPAGTMSTYHLTTSTLPTSPPAGLVVYLDGDGMYGHDNPTSTWALGGARGVAAQAGARGYATLSIRTPDRTGTPTFWENGRVNAAYVAALIRKVSADLGTSTTWLVGYSGGSQLITKFLVPAHASLFAAGGGAVITGGGGAPAGSTATFDPAARAKFPMLWHTGLLDNGRDYDALSDARRGEAWYQARGFVTAREEPAGVDHSDLGTQFGTILARQLDRYPATGGTTTPPPAPTAPAPTTPPTATPTPTPAPTQAPPKKERWDQRNRWDRNRWRSGWR